METTPEVSPRPRRAADFNIVVRSGVFTFQPLNENARTWLECNVTPEFHSDDLVVVGPLRARHLLFWMALEGLVIQ